MKKLALLSLLFIPILAWTQDTFKWKKKTYLVYPQRQDLYRKKEIIPALQEIPDGDYIVFAEKPRNKKRDPKQVTITFSIVNGKKEGPATWYFRNGKIACKGQFVNDIPEGTWYEYYSNKKIRKIEEVDHGYTYWGHTTYYHRNGKLQEGFIVTDSVNNRKEYRKLDNKGNIRELKQFKRSLGDGEFVAYDYKGNIEARYTMKNGDLIGGIKHYDHDSVIDYEIILMEETPDSIYNSPEISYIDHDEWIPSFHIEAPYIYGFDILDDFYWDAGYWDQNFTGWIKTYSYWGKLTGQFFYENGTHIYTAPLYTSYGQPLHTAKLDTINDSTVIYTTADYNYEGKPTLRTYWKNNLPDSIIKNTYYYLNKDIEKYGKEVEEHYYSIYSFSDILEKDTVVCKRKTIVDGELVNKELVHMATNTDISELAKLNEQDDKVPDSTHYYWDAENKSLNFSYIHRTKAGSSLIENGYYKLSENSLYFLEYRHPDYHSTSTKILHKNSPLNGPIKFVFNENSNRKTPIIITNKKDKNLIKIHPNLCRNRHELIKDLTTYEFDLFTGKSGGYGEFNGSYVNGNKEGEWTFQNKRGNYWSKGTYKNNLADGTFTATGTVKRRLINQFYDYHYGFGDRMRDLLSRTTRRGWDYNSPSSIGYCKNSYFYPYQWHGFDTENLPKKYSVVFYEENYQKGKLHGSQKYFFPDGSIEHYEEYNLGQKHGTFYSLHTNKDTTYKASFKHGLKDGNTNTYFEGKLISSIPFKNDIADGTYLAYYKDGSLLEKGNIKDGNMIGEWNIYYNGGNKKSVIHYSIADSAIFNKWQDPDGYIFDFTPPSITETQFYESGDTMSVRTTRMGIYEDEWNFYAPNGTKVEQLQFFTKEFNKDSVRIPWEAKGWFDNGAPKYEAICEYITEEEDCVLDIMRPGMELSYYNIWNKEGHQVVKNGNGMAVLYHSNGLKSAEGELIDGLESGIWKYWDENGKLNQIGQYDSGAKDGKWLTGDLEGLHFVDQCFNPEFGDIEELIKQEENKIEVSIIYYDNGSKLTYYQFNRDNN